MKQRIKLPPLIQLIHSWKTIGTFHFYKKFLEESRKPLGNERSVEQKKPIIYTLTAIRRKIASLGNLSILIDRCFFVSKNRIIIFNHSTRKRMDKSGLRPLYLFKKNFNLDDMVVFEDKVSAFTYPKGTVQFNSECIDQTVGLIGFLLNKYYKLIYDASDRDIIDFVVKMRLWMVIFAILRPLRIHVLVWYGKEPLIAACKNMGLDVWDLQHGVIYEEHPIYNIMDTRNIVGSNFLLPDKCLVYGEYWRQHLLRSGWAEKKVNVVGYFPDVEPGFLNVSEIPYVLYTSQPHRNQAIIGHIQAIEVEVLRRGWRIIIALHPSESGDAYAEVLSAAVQLSKFDSYDLMRNCIVHLSVSSTLLWEAMLFEKSSYILDFGQEAVGLLKDFIKYGYGRTLSEYEFPEPFILPVSPGPDFFFCSTINKRLLNGLAVTNH